MSFVHFKTTMGYTMRKIRETRRFLIPVIGLTALLVILSGCESQENGKSDNLKTLEEKNKDFVRANTEDFWNKHNIAAYDKYYTTDFIIHHADGDQNREQDKKLCQAFFSAFPDLHLTLNDLVAEGDKVAFWTANCTHKGEFMGIPATGKRIEFKGIDVYRIADGKIAEVWASGDYLGMMQQLGAIPLMNE
jgi:steroid delta-isomerase-like uncharacterized protein